VTIKAAPERVFDAWLDPSVAARFLAAGDSNSATLKNDPREGGAFSLVMHGATADNAHEGHYVQIDRPRRLVFTWISNGTDRMLSLVTVSFTAVDGGVRVDLEHEGIPNEEKAGAHSRGWASIMAKLAALDLS